MTLKTLLDELGRRGVRLAVDDDRLVVRAGKGALDADLVAALRDQKPRLLELLRGTGGPAAGSVDLRRREDPSRVVASLGQRRFWELHRLAPEPSVLNVPGAFRLAGPLDVEALRDALQTFVDRHEILRSVFRDGPDGPGIEIVNEVRVDLPIEDLAHVDPTRREAVLRDTLEARADEPLDLERGPAFAIRLLRLGREDHALLFVAHSLVWDGWSFDVLLSELAVHYAVRIGVPGAEAAPELPVQYADFAAWQQRRLSSGLLERSVAYWRRQMSGSVPSLQLPTVAVRGSTPSYAGARSWFVLDAEVVEGIRALARTERTTPYAVLLAAFAALLHRYSGVEDVLVASPLYGRDRPELESLVGVFANTLFLRTAVEPEVTFRELVHRARVTTADAVEHQSVPTERVAALLQEGSGARSPYEALFVFQQTEKRASAFGPVQVRSIRRGTRRVAVDLTVWVREYEDYFDGAFDFRKALFEPATIEAMKGHFERIVREAVLKPDTAVGELEFTDGEEIGPGGSGARDARRVAAVLERHPDVAEAAAVMQPSSEAASRLVAYVVWNTEVPPFDSEVRRFVAAELPEGLVPAVTVPLDRLPRREDGAVQISELPNPFGVVRNGAGDGLRTETERVMAEVWTELLGVDEVGPDDNFFDLGGHSLLAVEAVARLERRLGTRIVARDTFFLSLRKIATGIDAAEPSEA